MNRTDPDFSFNASFPTLSEEEANSFLDKLFDNLFDTDDISSDSDRTPDLGKVD
jgi:hypothetical protein